MEFFCKKEAFPASFLLFKAGFAKTYGEDAYNESKI